MKFKELDMLRRRLTMVFTIIIFLIVLSLQIVFFGYKYIRDIRFEVGKLYELRAGFQNFMLRKPQFNQGGMMGPRNSIPESRQFNDRPLRLMRGLEHSNIVVEQNGVFIFQIIDNLSQEILLDIFGNIQNHSSIVFDPRSEAFRITIDGNLYLFTFGGGNSPQGEFKFMILTRLNIEADDFIKDFITFLIISLIFGILIYLLGSKFVSYNLKPVEQKMEDMDDFVHNAGHELKTPIAVINSSLQTARDIKDYDEAIEDSLNEIKKMDDLITGLVTLSTIEKPEKLESIMVNTELKKILKSFNSEIENKKINVNIIENLESEIQGNLYYFIILINNIIKNAIRYNKKGGKIDIIINKSSIQISDTGIGISKENLKHIYKRFYKENEARNKEGFGIGLALVKKIVNIYGWKISIESEKAKGTTVVVKF